MKLIDLIVSQEFLWSYIGLMTVASVVKIAAGERALRREHDEISVVMHILQGSTDPMDKLRLLQVWAVGGRAALDGVKSVTSVALSSSRSITQRATRTFLAAITSIEVAGHVRDGFRPGDEFFRERMRAFGPQTTQFADGLVRVSLLGTFIGMIAALSIASYSLSGDLGGSGNGMQKVQFFLEQLLESAAIKFWISAAGLGLAIFLRIWQVRVNHRLDVLGERLGYTFEMALKDANVSGAWCPR